MFWIDNWVLGEAIQDFAHALTALISARRKCKAIVATNLAEWGVDPLDHWWRVCLGNCREYMRVWDAITCTMLSLDTPDPTVWWWTLDDSHSAKSAYHAVHVGSVPLLGSKLI